MKTLRICTLVASLVIPTAGWAQDSDRDGVADSADAFPCDPTASAVAYVPAEGQRAQLMFEDQWPAAGDLDFNDAVLAYHYTFMLTATGEVTGLRLTLDARAVGGVFDNGVGLRLPLPAVEAASVTRSVDGAPPTAITPSPADSELVVVLSNNLRELFGGTQDQINSLENTPFLTGAQVVLEVRLVGPRALPISQAPFDLFLFRSNDPTHEIHKPAYRGTARMDPTRFGTQDDATDIDRAFVEASGLPFVLDVPDATFYPSEGTPISTLYPNILSFASSGGAAAQDFYTSPQGVNNQYQGNGLLGPSLPVIDNSPDASCVLYTLPTQGIATWLDAGDLTAIGQGAPVATWPDRSGAGGDAAQGSAGLQPTLQLDQLNGHPTVRFDGSNDRLDLASNLFANANYPLSVFVVLRTTDTSAHVLGTGSSSAGYLTSYGGGLTIVGGLPTLKANSASSGLRLSANASISNGAARVVAAIAGATSSDLFVNGARVGEGGGTPNAHGYSRSSLGASDGSRSNASRDPFAGDIAEVIVYHSALDPIERMGIEQYLGSKYGITVTLEPGCDGVAGSGLVVDLCGQCGGDNSSCGADQLPTAAPRLWLRASDLTVGNGAPVSAWDDVSGSAAHASQSTGTRRPRYWATGMNGRPAVEFDGVDDRLDLASNVFGSSAFPLTYCVVLSTTDSSAHVFGTGSSSAGYLRTYGGGMVIDGGLATLKANSGGSGAYLSGSTLVSDGAPHVFCAVATSGDSAVFLNGTEEGSSTSNANAHGYSKSTLGASDGSSSNQACDPFAGSIAELLVYGGALDEHARLGVEAYLSQRYGITVYQPPGCDGVAGSGLDFDACGQCGGDGTTCGADAVSAAGLQLWLRPGALQGLADGALVSDWPDSSSQRRTTSQATATRTPVFRPNAFGGIGGVSFDGADDRLDLDTNLFSSADYPQTIFVVMRSVSANAHVLGTGSSSAGFLNSYGGGLTLVNGRPTLKANSASSGLHLSAATPANDGLVKVVSGVASNGGSTIYVDCAASGIASSATNPNGYTRATIGASDGANSNAARDPFAGEVAEIIVYDQVLPDASREAIQSYLATKYGVPSCPNTGPSAQATLAAGVTAFWKMDEAGTGNRQDLMGALPVAPYPPSAIGTTSIPAIVGSGQLVDGPNGYHFWRSSAANLNHGGGSFTWAGWMRVDSTYDDQTFVGKWNLNPAAGREYLVIYDRVLGKFAFKVSGNGLASDIGIVVHPEAVQLGQWYFLKAWHDAASGTINLRVGTPSMRGGAATQAWTSGVYFGSADLNIAAHDTCAEAHLDGAIDAVGFWRRTLTSAESDALWNQGAGWEP